MLQYREENNVVRNDYLHVVSQLKQTEDFKFTDEDVTAHAAGFFGEGYETSSILMSFVLFELAANLDVQEKLREEVRRVYEENGNELPYETLQALPYLDGVINGKLEFSCLLDVPDFGCRNPSYSSADVFASENLYRGF